MPCTTFLLVGILVLVPLLFPLKLPIAVSGPAQRFYTAVEKVPDGSIVVISGDFDPASAPELMPMTNTAVRHLFKKNCRIIALELWPGGPPLVDGVLHKIGGEMGKKYGTDYVNLGYKSGNEVVMLAFGGTFSGTFPNDYSGTPVSTLPLMQDADKTLIARSFAATPGTKTSPRTSSAGWTPMRRSASRFHSTMWRRPFDASAKRCVKLRFQKRLRSA